MKMAFLLLAFLLLAFFWVGSSIVAGQDTSPAKSNSDTDLLAEANNKFAFDLYSKLSTQEGNIVFSPYSISAGLSMAYAGARGETAEEMAKALAFTLPQERLHPAFAELARRLQTGDKKRPYDLHIANSLWGANDVVLPSFSQLMTKYYGAALRDVDFALSADTARRSINRWVEEKTKDKIKDLLVPGDVNSATVLVLVNALYLKGSWEFPFLKEKTTNADFEVFSGRKIKVPMMLMTNTEGHLWFSRSQEGDWLELRYRGDRLSMVIVAPRKRGDLAGLEKSLNAKTWKEAIRLIRREQGSVALPRFKIDQRFDLSEKLQSLGMHRAFSGADFSGICGSKGWAISKVAHKAFVDVDEEGTEAAAATGVVLSVTDTEPIAFRADQPFVFAVRDRTTGAILFLGRVANPTASN